MNLALDLDGTLIGCEPRQSAVLQVVLARRGQPVDLGRAWELKRNGASTEQALVQLGLSPVVARQVAEEWRNSIEAPVWLGLDSVLGGVSEVLKDMRATGARLALITSRTRREWVPQQLERLGLSPWLDEVTVVSPENAVTRKAESLRRGSAVAFFGDTESDHRSALEADVPFFGVSCGQRSGAFLAKSGVKAVHHDLAAAWEAFRTESRRHSRG